MKKGDPLETARLAGIMAAKQTSSLIPLCHPLPLSHADVQLTPVKGGYEIEAAARTIGADRRRDGGADRGGRRGADHLRHGQGGRQGDGDRRHPPGQENEMNDPRRHLQPVRRLAHAGRAGRAAAARVSGAHVRARATSDAEALERIPDADVAFGARLTPEHLAAAPAAALDSQPGGRRRQHAVSRRWSRRRSRSPTPRQQLGHDRRARDRGHARAAARPAARVAAPGAKRVWAQNEFNAGAPIRTLREARVLIVGLGSIGAAAARLAAAFGAHVVGIRRRAGRTAARPAWRRS